MEIQKDKSDLLAVVIMVKDEAISIQATLNSYFEEGIRHFFVFDTGSTDNTIALTQEFFKKNKLNGSIQQEPFIDFATSRNRALELAEHHFATIPFLLMPDAEWFLHGGKHLLDFCEKEELNQTTQYLVCMKLNRIEFYTARLFRSASKVRFKGVVHEAPDATPIQVKAPATAYFEIKATEQGIAKSHKRWRQDLKLLFSAHIDDPTHPRTAFYLAQTYECLGDTENAFAMYKVREKINGWEEENYVTLFRLGRLAETKYQDNPQLGWSIAMDYYLKAFAMRPHRIEPLIKIADHYWPDNVQTCYLFARHAYTIPFPKNDLLFVEKEMYDYSRYEIISRCAWYVGEYALGEQATLMALNARPNTAHLLKNLTLYQQKNAVKTIEQTTL
ncbi:MAG: hypothetical protein WC627_11680 [Legionella sp.]